VARHRVFQAQPNWRARPWTEAFSLRICPTAQPTARVVSNARRPATLGSCSRNVPVGHDGSGHNQRRFRHTSLTGEPKHGASISRTDCRP